MAAVSSHNPSFADFESQAAAKQSGAPRLSQAPSVMFNPDVVSNRGRNRSIATVAAVAVVGAAALAVGVVLGGSISSSSSPVAETASAVIVDPSSVLASMYVDQPSLSSITFEDLNKLVDQYEKTHSPNQWANNFVPEQFVSEWSKLRQSEPLEEQEEPVEGEDPDAARRLREQRRLIGAYPQERTRVAQDSTFARRVNPIVFENDAAGVEKKGSRCIISFDTSNDFADWADNLNLGNGPIFSVNEYTESGPSCPISTCRGKRILGQGYDGFREAWNGLNTRVWARIQSTCSSGINEYVFTGYSRGGGIAAIASAAIYLEGLLPASQIKLITFGSPLSLSTTLSNSVHNRFEQFRFVFRSDPVPAIPPRAFGVRHFGEMRCIECRRNREGRDRPSFPNFFGIGNHGGYQGWNP